jgi:hypothetical protein
MKRLINLIVTLILSITLLALAGCGDGKSMDTTPGAGKTTVGPSTTTGVSSESVNSYKVGETFVVNGLTFTVEKVESLKKIRNTFGGSSYVPANGQFLAVTYRFNGLSTAETAGYDTAAIKIQDNDNQYYDDLSGEDILTDLAMQRDIQMLSFATINDTQEKVFISLYDVPAGVEKLVWLELVSLTPVKLKVLAEVKLGTIPDTTETIELGSAKDWFALALEKAKDWQEDAKLLELDADNVSTATRLEEDKGEYAAALKEAPMDGTVETWKYYFISEKASLPFMVTVTQGEIVKSEEATMFLFNAYKDLKKDEDWKINSPDALTLALTKVTGNASDGADITYAMHNTSRLENMVNVFRIRWQIRIETVEGNVTTVEIDATTGEILEVDQM